MAYLEIENLKQYLGASSTGDDGLLTTILAAAQKEIENFCGRTFEASTGTRNYRPEDIKRLPMGSQYTLGQGGYSWDAWPSGESGNRISALMLDDDLLSVDSLLNGDGTAINSTSYWLEPRNEPPYMYIRLKSDESWVFGTDGQIAVAGTWGFSTAPDATIQWLTMEMAGYLYRNRDNPVYDITATPELGIITVPKGMPQHVKYALEQGGYVRAQRFV